MVTGRRGIAGRVSIARLRRWLLAGVVVLVLVLGGLLGYARYRAHKFLADLPHRLGMDITSETNDFTYSQSLKGRKIFTLHAAKAIQRQNGKTTLHNVSILLYGPPGTNRTDTIRGDEFEYDQPNGVVKAAGIVHLDLALPAQTGAPVKADAKRAQVTTSGLVFLQKLGVAATDQPIQVVYADLHGSAVGADYESDTGILRLRSDVRMDGTQQNQPIHVDATAAEMDRNVMLATLSRAHVQSGTNRAAGDTVLLNLAKDGSIQSVDGTGHVVLRQADGPEVHSARMHATLSPTGKLVTVALAGGMTLDDGDTKGSAGYGLLHFNAAGQPVSADLQHAVHLDQSGAAGVARSLTAEHVVAALEQDAAKHTVLRDATATGNAVLRSVETAAAGKRPGSSIKAATTQTTVITAQTLHAVTSTDGAGKRYVSALNGTGSTRIQQSDDAGNDRTSSGDTLQVTLRDPSAGGATGAGGAVQDAVQTGNVTVTQHAVATPAASAAGRKGTHPPGAQDSRAVAQRAEFDSATDRLLLTGSPMVTAPGVQLAADNIALQQGTGDADAQGSVRGTFVQEPANGASTASADPTHVLADHATIAGSGGAAKFFGGTRPARMWNTTAQLEAPEVDLDRAQGTLSAHSVVPVHGTPTVHLVLTSSGTPKPGSRAGDTGPVRITGEDLVMTGASGPTPGHIEVSRTVRLITATSNLTANHVTATLRDSDRPGSGAKASLAISRSPLESGSIESIVATGDIHLQQPGRTGTGDRLVYTAADSRYELTGTPSALPTMTDSLRGKVTGDALIFHSGDDSVEVAGEKGRRVRTETHAASPSRTR